MPGRMRAGQLRKRIVFVSIAEKDSPVGKHGAQETPQGFAWASYTPWRGEEGPTPSGEIAKSIVYFECRHRNDVDPKWAIRFAGALYDIEDVQEIGDREGLRIKAVVRNKDGRS